MICQGGIAVRNCCLISKGKPYRGQEFAVNKSKQLGMTTLTLCSPTGVRKSASETVQGNLPQAARERIKQLEEKGLSRPSPCLLSSISVGDTWGLCINKQIVQIVSLVKTDVNLQSLFSSSVVHEYPDMTGHVIWRTQCGRHYWE